MSRTDKLIQKLLSGASDANFNFEELKNVLYYFGFEERRTGGSHHIFLRKE